jgi:hypothetical protein
MNHSPDMKPPKSNPLPPPSALPYTFKANLAEYRRRLGIWRFILAFGLTFIIFLRFGVLAWALTVVLITAVILTVMYLLSRRSLTLTKTHIEFTNSFGKVKKLEYHDIQSFRIFVNYVEPSFGLTPRIIIATDKRPFVSLVGMYWNLEDLDRLLSTIKDKKIDTEYFEDFAYSAQIAKQFPHSVPVYERHPYWIAFGIVILLLVVISVGVLLSMTVFD